MVAAQCAERGVVALLRRLNEKRVKRTTRSCAIRHLLPVFVRHVSYSFASRFSISKPKAADGGSMLARPGFVSIWNMSGEEFIRT